MMDLAALLNQVAEIATEAGSEIMAVYARDFTFKEKSDLSPLTEADERAHALIVRRLALLTHQLPILSEEDVNAFPGPDAEGRYWLVDPLDGTKEFIKRNGEFTVNIALISQGQSILGVVHAPVLDVSYLAAVGVGAFKQIGQGSRCSIAVAERQAASPWRVVGSRSHGGDSLTSFLARLGDHELVPMGSSLKFCLVAEGVADIYPRLGPTSLWDTAAAQCVVEQAGGSVVTLEGRVLSYGAPANLLNPNFVVASNHCLNAINELRLIP